jgi:molybdopterin synthase sulfur carrier subunit
MTASVAAQALAARARTPVSLEIVYLARLREALGRPGERLALTLGPVAPGASSPVGAGATAVPASAPTAQPTVATLLAHLRARGGAFAHELAAGRAFRVAVNHAMASDATPLCDGDEVALFPPVTGG